MQNDENKVTLVIKKFPEAPNPKYNCEMEITKKSARVLFPMLGNADPIAMSKCYIKEGPTHIEFKISLSDDILKSMIKVFHQHAFKVCVNDN
jgi:hypothetical protein